MIKLMGCILIIAASTTAGFILAEGFKKRSMQLKELLRAVIQLENEIMYTRTTLPEAFMKVAEKSRKPIGKIFNEVSDRLIRNRNDTVFEAFSEVIAEIKDETNLSKRDTDIIIDLAKELGDSDIEGHRKMFLLAEDSLKKNIDEAERIVERNTKMYRYLGFSFGAVVTILLI